jgi:hypothetical protein
VEELAKQWPASHWHRFRLLEGHKGPLVADFLVLRAILPLDRLPGPEIWVVIRRKVSGSAEEPEWKFYLSNAPPETPLATFVRVSGMRWPIETCFAECKGELGMDHYELRFWRGWHHHMTLVILAHHFLVRWQQCLNQREGVLRPTTMRPLPTPGEVPSLDAHASLPLSVAQVRLLLQVALPQPVLDLPAALALISYQQRHNYAAYCSHRKRLLAQLQGLRW